MNCKTLLFSGSKPFKNRSNGSFIQAVRSIVTSPNAEGSHQPMSKEVEEVKIPVPWGHIAAKWWGPKNKRPILMAHGWQDNCGTFNTLIPHLRSNIGYLAFDFPGHGLSSHFPLGTFSLHGVENAITLRRIVKYFNWDSVSLISHSMGSIASFDYAALFPEKVDFLIGLDTIKLLRGPPTKVMEYLPQELDNYFKAEEYVRIKNEPPSYTFDDLIKRLHLATRKSIDEDKCHHLLERNVKRSSKDANMFYFSRDSRLKNKIVIPPSNEVSFEMAKRIKCRMLIIKAESGPYYGKKELFFELVDILKKHNPLFEFVKVPGMHHVHLNEPERVAPLVNDYLDKYAQDLAN